METKQNNKPYFIYKYDIDTLPGIGVTIHLKTNKYVYLRSYLHKTTNIGGCLCNWIWSL